MYPRLRGGARAADYSRCWVGVGRRKLESAGRPGAGVVNQEHLAWEPGNFARWRPASLHLPYPRRSPRERPCDQLSSAQWSFQATTSSPLSFRQNVCPGNNTIAADYERTRHGWRCLQVPWICSTRWVADSCETAEWTCCRSSDHHQNEGEGIWSLQLLDLGRFPSSQHLLRDCCVAMCTSCEPAWGLRETGNKSKGSERTVWGHEPHWPGTGKLTIHQVRHVWQTRITRMVSLNPPWPTHWPLWRAVWKATIFQQVALGAAARVQMANSIPGDHDQWLQHPLRARACTLAKGFCRTVEDVLANTLLRPSLEWLCRKLGPWPGTSCILRHGHYERRSGRPSVSQICFVYASFCFRIRMDYDGLGWIRLV